MENSPHIPRPALGKPNRAHVKHQFMEDGDLIEVVSDGWAEITNGGWMLFLDDEADTWVSWPPETVLFVKWTRDDV